MCQPHFFNPSGYNLLKNFTTVLEALRSHQNIADMRSSEGLLALVPMRQELISERLEYDCIIKIPQTLNYCDSNTYFNCIVYAVGSICTVNWGGGPSTFAKGPKVPTVPLPMPRFSAAARID